MNNHISRIIKSLLISTAFSRILPYVSFLETLKSLTFGLFNTFPFDVFV